MIEYGDDLIPSQDIVNKLSEIIFDDIFPLWQCGAIQERFPYTCTAGFQADQNWKEGTMILRIITKADDIYYNPLMLQDRSASYPEALIVLDLDASMIQSLETLCLMEKTKDRNGFNPDLQNYLSEQKEQAESEFQAADHPDSDVRDPDHLTSNTQRARALSAESLTAEDYSFLYIRLKEMLEDQIIRSTIYIGNNENQMNAKSAYSRLEQTLYLLKDYWYPKNSLLTIDISTDELNSVILSKNKTGPFMKQLKPALEEMLVFLNDEFKTRMNISVSSLQNHFQQNPYGWNENDIALILICLIENDQAELKSRNRTLTLTELDPSMLTGSFSRHIVVCKNQKTDQEQLRQVRSFLKEYFQDPDIPRTATQTVEYLTKRFYELKSHYQYVQGLAQEQFYPCTKLISEALQLFDAIRLSNETASDRFEFLLSNQDLLKEHKNNLKAVEYFFQKQKPVFDASKAQYDKLSEEKNLFKETLLYDTFLKMEAVLIAEKPFEMIEELDILNQRSQNEYNDLIAVRKEKLKKEIDEALVEINNSKDPQVPLNSGSEELIDFLKTLQSQLNAYRSLSSLDNAAKQTVQAKEKTIKTIQILKSNWKKRQTAPAASKPQPKPELKEKVLFRFKLCHAGKISSEEDIINYVNEIQARLHKELQDCDILKIE